MKIKSPITHSSHVSLEREIEPKYISKLYKEDLHFDVKKYFRSGRKIKVYKCQDSGYRFYYPFDLSGDSEFYEKLEKFTWYYMDWKWEHEITKTIIKPSDTVLEIGCADGSFLERIKPDCKKCIGLETNQKAIKRAIKRGIEIVNQTIEKFASKNKQECDIVCSFQVLEHIADVRDFITSSLSVLKPGGKLIISVPNNDCLLIMGHDTPLNMPPHHMGLWNLNSLLKLQNFFDMKVQLAYLEPLQQYHLSFATNIANREIENKLRQRFGPLSPIAEKFAQPITYAGISAIKNSIIGHTVLVVFQKND